VLTDIGSTKPLTPANVSQKPDPQRPRGTLIITDRTMDTVAPLLHEFTYQAMANDLLHIVNGRSYTYRFQSRSPEGGGRKGDEYEDRTAILSDADQLWTAVRHLHISEAIGKLKTDFNVFLEENAGFRPGYVLA
jgi:syntaxin-binding protein 1